MNNCINNMEEILNHSIFGFHRYTLTSPAYISFASQNLCELLEIQAEDLLQKGKDAYAEFVHPSDAEMYRSFVRLLNETKAPQTMEYRLVSKSGKVLYVKDSVTVSQDTTGLWVADSVLTDITDLKNENQNLQFLNETIPCGFMKYTCEKHPRITYINQQMKDIFRFEQPKEGELDYFELYKSDILLMVPMEERRRFSLYLNRVYSAGIPIAGEMTLLRCDGTRAHVFGWVTKCVNEQGVEEFQSVCMDVTHRHRTKVAAETKRYLKALTDVYDKIFEFNISRNTVKCLYAHDSMTFKHFENVAMQIDEATEKWITDAVVGEDRDAVRKFFADFCQRRLYTEESKPPQIAYRARSSSGDIKTYTGVFIKLDDAVSFYCCRQVANQEETEVLRTENLQLREEMKELVIRFTDGVAAFEVSPTGMVKPLYASDNVCEFFGYTKEEWLELMENATPLENFVSYSDVAYEEYAELLRKGEAEFTYYDIHSETEKRIKAICSQREATNTARYVMLYTVDGETVSERKVLQEKQGVSIRTFGYFDVFVGDRPIAFRNKKSKELFALLVDRRGGYIDSEEAISFLWEDEPVNSVILARYRKVALRLKNTLEEYGIAEIMETVDGKRRIVTEKVQCDLFDYLSGKPEYTQLFKGSYLSNYSWGENTLGELMNVQE